MPFGTVEFPSFKEMAYRRLASRRNPLTQATGQRRSAQSGKNSLVNVPSLEVGARELQDAARMPSDSSSYSTSTWDVRCPAHLSGLCRLNDVLPSPAPSLT